MKLIRSTPVGGDCCAGYTVIIDEEREVTVADLIIEILSHKYCKSGNITVTNEPNCKYRNESNTFRVEYKNGLILDEPGDVLKRRVRCASANGGYGQMNFTITYFDGKKHYV